MGKQSGTKVNESSERIEKVYRRIEEFLIYAIRHTWCKSGSSNMHVQAAYP